MDFLHSTWFWVLIIIAPAISVIGAIARSSTDAKRHMKELELKKQEEAQKSADLRKNRTT